MKPFADYPAWDGAGLPTRENCDLENPRQAVLWMYTALPGVKGAPLILPTAFWEMVSYHQWSLGARPDAGEVTMKYRPPRESVLNRWTAAGKWVPVDEPDPDPDETLANVVKKMPQAQRMALRSLLEAGEA